MYQPGMITERQLAQVRYAEFLDEAAQERASRRPRVAAPKQAGQRLALVLAGAAPVAVVSAWMVWLWAGH